MLVNSFNVVILSYSGLMTCLSWLHFVIVFPLLVKLRGVCVVSTDPMNQSTVSRRYSGSLSSLTAWARRGSLGEELAEVEVQGGGEVGVQQAGHSLPQIRQVFMVN